MNIGNGVLQVIQQNAQPLVIVAIIIIGLILGFKREFTKLVVFVLISIIAVGLVFNPYGVQGVFLNIFNAIVH